MHHRHATTHAQQAGQKARGQAKREQLDDEHDAKVHGGGVQASSSRTTACHSSALTGVMDSRLPDCNTRIVAS